MSAAKPRITFHILVDCGGTSFKTTNVCLARSPMLLRSFPWLIDGDGGKAPAKPPLVFLDRDPEMFKHVLRVMRDPTYVFAFPFEHLSELKHFEVDVPITDIHVPWVQQLRNDLLQQVRAYHETFVTHFLEGLRKKQDEYDERTHAEWTKLKSEWVDWKNNLRLEINGDNTVVFREGMAAHQDAMNEAAAKCAAEAAMRTMDDELGARVQLKVDTHEGMQRLATVACLAEALERRMEILEQRHSGNNAEIESTGDGVTVNGIKITVGE